MLLVFFSKPAEFRIGDLGYPQIIKPADVVPQVLPDPQTTVIQSDPAAEDASADKAGGTPAGVQKEVAEEKISAADVGKILVLISCRSQLVVFFLC